MLDAATETLIGHCDGRGVSKYYTRDYIVGGPTYWKIGSFGAIQFKNEYDLDLLSVILRKAITLKDAMAVKRHLNLRYIRGAQRYIPEISDLIHDRARLERLIALTQVRLEPYPISVISSIITFMGPQDHDGTVDWHCDGVPCTELIPLSMNDLEGGELEIYRGNSEVGLSLIEEGQDVPQADVLKIEHKPGCSTVGQFLRVLHRTAPILKGYRVTLNLNLRSQDKPYVDDNNLVYLGADNPDGDWHAEYLADIQARQLPAYKAAMQVA